MNQKEKPRFAKKQDSVYCQEYGIKRQEEKWFFSEQSERCFSFWAMPTRQGMMLLPGYIWELVHKDNQVTMSSKGVALQRTKGVFLVFV